MSLAKRFRKARDISGFNQKDFGLRIGISQSAVSQIENSETKELSKSVAINIELRWGISSRWLITGKGKMFIQVDAPTPYDIIEDQSKMIASLKEDLAKWKEAVADLTGVAVKKKVRKK